MCLSGFLLGPIAQLVGSEALISVIKCLESVCPKSGSAGDVKTSLCCLCEESEACDHHGIHHAEGNIHCPHVVVLPTSSLNPDVTFV